MKQTSLVVLTLGLYASFWITSCATARVEESEPGIGGTIAVQPAQNAEAKDKAKVLMAENCGEKKAKIVKEGYVVVGSETRGSESAAPGEQRDLFSKKKTKTVETSSSSSTTSVKEWRITYKCL